MRRFAAVVAMVAGTSFVAARQSPLAEDIKTKHGWNTFYYGNVIS